jgi:hypothetical protein
MNAWMMSSASRGSMPKYSRMPARWPARRLRQAALDELVKAVEANEPKAHAQHLVRLVRQTEAALEAAGEHPDEFLARRQAVAAGAGLTANGARQHRPGGPRRGGRGQAVRAVR